jgi:hypothetical protein
MEDCIGSQALSVPWLCRGRCGECFCWSHWLQVTYEAYGAGGTGFVVECLTDNVNRSGAEVRTAVVKAGGKMADSGSVLFNFQRRGVVFVRCQSEEEVRMLCRSRAPACSELGQVWRSSVRWTK